MNDRTKETWWSVGIAIAYVMIALLLVAVFG